MGSLQLLWADAPQSGPAALQQAGGWGEHGALQQQQQQQLLCMRGAAAWGDAPGPVTAGPTLMPGGALGPAPSGARRQRSSWQSMDRCLDWEQVTE